MVFQDQGADRKGDGIPAIPDNSSMPIFQTLSDYFRYRQRMKRLAEYYKKTPLKVPDEQGLPHVRREILDRLAR